MRFSLCMGGGKRLGPLEEAFPAVKEIGYDGIEILSWDPAQVDAMRALSEGNGLPVVSVGGGANLLRLGSPESAEETAKELEARVRAAARLGDCVVLVTGGRLTPVPGRPGGPSEVAKILQAAAKALSRPSRLAEDLGICLVVEPLNRYESNVISTLEEADRFAGMVGGGGVKIMADIYHMNIAEESITGPLREKAEVIRHVHFADNHGGVPGTGTLNFKEILRTLKEIGYRRYVSLELHRPVEDYQSAIRKNLAYLRALDLVLS